MYDRVLNVFYHMDSYSPANYACSRICAKRIAPFLKGNSPMHELFLSYVNKVILVLYSVSREPTFLDLPCPQQANCEIRTN